MAARLSDFLVHDGALPVETIRVAVARQIVYGGALDTALLEMDALAEATIWNELSHASGLPIPDPDLVGAPAPAAIAGFDVARSERCRAVPVGRRGGRLQLLCGDPIEREALREISTELALDLELYVVPEVRLKMARQIVYGQPVPPRFVRLLGRVLGPDSARRWAEAHAPGAPANTIGTLADVIGAPANTVAAPANTVGETATTVAAPANTIAETATTIAALADTIGETATTVAAPANTIGETALVVRAPAPDETEVLCRVAADIHASGRIAALHALRNRLEHPRVRELAAGFRAAAGAAAPERVLAALIGITELRDRLAVPLLVDLVESKDADVADAARQALIEITRQDFGRKGRRWRSWMAAHGEEARIDWLFAGLGHRVADIRFAASEELWQITGEYFGYHHDSPKREREGARERWRDWWRSHPQNR